MDGGASGRERWRAWRRERSRGWRRPPAPSPEGRWRSCASDESRVALADEREHGVLRAVLAVTEAGAQRLERGARGLRGVGGHLRRPVHQEDEQVLVDLPHLL